MTMVVASRADGAHHNACCAARHASRIARFVATLLNILSVTSSMARRHRLASDGVRMDVVAGGVASVTL